MPRNRLLNQIDEELVRAHSSLKFWQEQMFLLPDELVEAAKAQVKWREGEIRQLLEAQEALIGAPDA